MSKTLTLWRDARVSIEVDDEEFEIIKIMIEEAGADQNSSKVHSVVLELEKQGYKRHRAISLGVLARRELLGRGH